MHVRAAVIFAVLIFTAGLHAQTQPTSAPVSADVGHLIKQLGSDSAQDRDSAQGQLVNIGPDVIPALKKAATDDDDPEIRSRASAAISQMKDQDANGVTLITLHKKDGNIDDVLNKVATLAHAQFVGYGIGAGMPVGQGAHTLSIDVDHKPFWDVMTDVCTQLNMCPVLDTPGKNAIRLYTPPRNWIAQSPHQIVGPYWIGIAGLNRTRNIDLMGPPVIDDQFLLRLIVLPEPKLAVTHMSAFNLKEVVDDAGNSLLPQQPPAQIPRIMRGYRQMNHVIESRLEYPKNPGKKISILRGEVAIQLAQDVQQVELDNVLGTPRLINPLKNCQIRSSVLRQGTDFFRVSIECTRQGLDDQQWNSMANRMNDLTLEDDAGHLLSPMSIAVPGSQTENSFAFSIIYSRNGLPGMGQVHQGNANVGDPKTLIWNVATSSKSVTVPVTFRDLPMP